MEIKKIKEELLGKVQWSSKKPKSALGGQSCGMPSYPVILKSEELDLEITVGYHRSQLKNKILAMTLFELAMDDLVK